MLTKQSHLRVEICDPTSALNSTYPTVLHAGRLCVAVPDGKPFAVRADVGRAGQLEFVVAVDGRDTLTNKPASTKAGGVVIDHGFYECRGFRTGSDGVRQFVCASLGRGATTAERSGTGHLAGLVAVVAYEPWYQPDLDGFLRRAPARSASRSSVMDWSAPLTRSFGLSGVTCSASGTNGESGPSLTSAVVRSAGPSAGAAAGEFVPAPVGKIEWRRGARVGEVVVEYDTPEGWAARGVSFDPPAPLPQRDPWPGDATAWCDPQTL